MHEFAGGVFDQTFAALARDGNAAHCQHHWRGEGGDAAEGEVVDAGGQLREHVLNAAEIDEATQGVLFCDLEHQVAGIVFSQGVVEDV